MLFCSVSSGQFSQNAPIFFGLSSETKYARYDGWFSINRDNLNDVGQWTVQGGCWPVCLCSTVVPTDVWRDSRPQSESLLSRSFPTGGEDPCTVPWYCLHSAVGAKDMNTTKESLATSLIRWFPTFFDLWRAGAVFATPNVRRNLCNLFSVALYWLRL